MFALNQNIIFVRSNDLLCPRSLDLGLDVTFLIQIQLPCNRLSNGKFIRTISTISFAILGSQENAIEVRKRLQKETMGFKAY
ncbi:hypothetical protein [Argonema galeatum]|uniref:hypothetical protein n=1 Tax=Argonema galeatum TaxID=2942762 RepID=UPI0020131CCA|nr:hypothetical protein [Argonema galeatum]MCL1463682.1 hypothetical protein [Argonema galeatum A003/A1]